MLLSAGFEPFDDPESEDEVPESVFVVLGSLDLPDESDLDRSDSLARAFAP